MFDLYLFEIECAEKIGAYKIADNLQDKLMKISSKDHKEVIKKIKKKFDKSSGFNDISYMQHLDKLEINVDPSMKKSVKDKIKDMADPFKVSFRYSSAKNIDELMSGSSIDPIEKHISRLKKLRKENPSFDIFKEEPSDEELKETSEFPDDEELSDSIMSLDQFLFLIALEDINKKTES